jgi:hypothetical protein
MIKRHSRYEVLVSLTLHTMRVWTRLVSCRRSSIQERPCAVIAVIHRVHDITIRAMVGVDGVANIP